MFHFERREFSFTFCDCTEYSSNSVAMRNNVLVVSYKSLWPLAARWHTASRILSVIGSLMRNFVIGISKLLIKTISISALCRRDCEPLSDHQVSRAAWLFCHLDKKAKGSISREFLLLAIYRPIDLCLARCHRFCPPSFVCSDLSVCVSALRSQCLLEPHVFSFASTEVLAQLGT